ncbi:MAG: hypothetical protein AAF626_01030 [Pseudomonadota bacterium]
MHPADELAHVRKEIARLRARADHLRAGFLSGALPCRSNAREVVVTQKAQRVFRRDRLPREILDDPSMWAMRKSCYVQLREIVTPEPDLEEDFDLIEAI